MALQAVFETVRHWLLYQGLALHLSPWDAGARLAYPAPQRRVTGAGVCGHPLALGYLFAVAFGFWLYLQPQIESRVKARGRHGTYYGPASLLLIRAGPG